MNILPKKRWHVRTKDNIARVRRDEAQAAEQEQERLRRVALAEQEFRTSILRTQAAERRGTIGETSSEQQAKLEPGKDVAKKEKDVSIVGASGHINFFSHLEDGERDAGPNEDYVREQKEEKEKYEKSIGYLTYLGQGSREETKQKAWFETLPVDRQKEQVCEEEVKRKAKALDDPLMMVKKLVGVDRIDITAASLAKPAAAAPVPVTPHHPPKSTEPAGTQKRGQDSAVTDGHSAKKHKKHVKHKRESRGKTKKSKHSRKRKRDDSGDRRHAKSRKRRRRSPSSGSSSSSESDGGAEEAALRKIRLERLRAERLQRERQERQRAEQLLSGLRGEQQPAEAEQRAPPEPSLKQRYNAQFNPYLARQNYRHN